MTYPDIKKYAFMQKLEYEYNAKKSKYDTGIRDSVVGSFEKQNEWKDYDKYLMKYLNSSYKNKIALDFGTGPGRNIVKYFKRFRRLDGVDISENNIKNARAYLDKNGVKNSRLYVNDGVSLNGVPSGEYDFIFSTICMQHICVHSIRFNLIKEMYRTLKVGGRISIQMGFGKNSPKVWIIMKTFTGRLQLIGDAIPVLKVRSR